jgi:hypothetical protein
LTSAAFSIGENERHVLKVDYSWWTGRIKVSLDSSELTESRYTLVDPKIRVFEVGEAEKHKVRIVDVGFYGHKYEILIDDKPAGRL